VRTVVLLIAAVYCASAADLPATLVSEDEAEPIRSAISRNEAWTQDSMRRLRAEADKRMRGGPWSIVTERPDGSEVNHHEYYSEAPLWWPNLSNPGGPYVRREGTVNAARFTANREALDAMCDAVFTLGTAAYLLDEPRYGRRAAHIVDTWFLNPKTRMNPNLDFAQVVRGLNNGRGTGIIEGRALIRAIQGMEFLGQTEYWDEKDEAAVRRWFVNYLHWLLESRIGVEERAAGKVECGWWIAQTAAVATFVEDAGAGKMAFDYYRDRLFPRLFHGRRNYSLFQFEGLALVCRMAQVQGIDLWDLRARGNAGIDTIIEAVQPNLGEERSRRGQAPDARNGGVYSLAFAGMGLKRTEYIALFRKLEQSGGAWNALADLLIGRWEASAHQTRH
jgi:hypothetical protein